MPCWSVAEEEGPWKARLMGKTVQLAGVVVELQRWTGVSAWSRKQGVISMGYPGQRTSQLIGPECSERRWNRHWEHPEDLCPQRSGDSVFDRLPRFAYFRSLTSSQLSYLILQVL